MSNLLIVESPGKVQKIQSYLGRAWVVMASCGHVRDLPVKELGVDLHSLQPCYVPTDRGKSTLAKLATAVKAAEAVYLATDPDREGEAIAWHLADALHLQAPKRVTFAEITEQAILRAVKAPRQIDMALVTAQEGRRVLDRLVGYQVSPPLSRLLGGKNSAGRVQSPALRLVVDREREIRAFTVTTHFGVDLIFDAIENVSAGWKATWKPDAWLEPGQRYILDKELATRVSGIRKVSVASCTEQEVRKAPPPPFTTSSLQQAASIALKLSPKETMALAQKLYEAGHITYMRTDSPNFCDEAVAAIQEFCRSQNLPVVSQTRHWKSKDGAQEAHEAIRPTHIEVAEAGESDAEKALYGLIRQRTLATQLVDAIFSLRSVILQGDDVDGRKPEFEAKGRTLVDAGWKIVLEKDQTDEAEEEPDNPVPALQGDSQLTVGAGLVRVLKTSPPGRYSEASLIKALESRGIGRPSTYAKILENIITRQYVKIEKRKLLPTECGEAVIDALSSRFGFLDYDYTKKMEELLDALAAGKASYLTAMQQFKANLDTDLASFSSANTHSCPDCGKPLRHMLKEGTKSKKGYDFWGCSGYPDCKATFIDANGKPGSRCEPHEKPELSQYKCPKCGKPLIHRINSSYNFWGCSGFPKCRESFKDNNGQPEGVSM